MRRAKVEVGEDRISEEVLFPVLRAVWAARDLTDEELAGEWNQANQMEDVTVWYHVLSCEVQRRWPNFPGGLRRSGSASLRGLNQLAGHCRS